MPLHELSNPGAHNPIKELEGRVAIITGGSSGIGLAIGKRYVQAGARIAILSRDEEELKNATGDIAKVDGYDKALPVLCDVRREGDVLAELALFLASDRSAKITGALVSIDGGGASGYVR